MLPALRTHRFLIARRSKQTLTLLLLIGGASWGWTIVRGNLSAAKVLDAVPLTDPFALLQMLAAGSLASAEAWIGAIVVVLLYGVVAGRAFCSWVCPPNMVTDAPGRVLRPRQPVEDPARYARQQAMHAMHEVHGDLPGAAGPADGREMGRRGNV